MEVEGLKRRPRTSFSGYGLKFGVRAYCLDGTLTLNPKAFALPGLPHLKS